MILLNRTPNARRLEWTASSDNVGVVGCRVYVGSSLVGQSTGTAHTVTTLRQNSNHELSVRTATRPQGDTNRYAPLYSTNLRVGVSMHRR